MLLTYVTQDNIFISVINSSLSLREVHIWKTVYKVFNIFHFIKWGVCHYLERLWTHTSKLCHYLRECAIKTDLRETFMDYTVKFKKYHIKSSFAERFILTPEYLWHVGSKRYTSHLHVVTTDTAAFFPPWHQSLYSSVENLCYKSVAWSDNLFQVGAYSRSQVNTFFFRSLLFGRKF